MFSGNTLANGSLKGNFGFGAYQTDRNFNSCTGNCDYSAKPDSEFPADFSAYYSGLPLFDVGANIFLAGSKRMGFLSLNRSIGRLSVNIGYGVSKNNIRATNMSGLLMSSKSTLQNTTADFVGYTAGLNYRITDNISVGGRFIEMEWLLII